MAGTGSRIKGTGVLKVEIQVTVGVGRGIGSHRSAIEEEEEIHRGLLLIKDRGYVNFMRVGIARKDLNVIICILEFLGKFHFTAA